MSSEAVKKSSAIGDPARLVLYLGRLVRDPRVPRSAKLKLLGAGLYAWVDGDLVPDTISLIPGLGLLDDVVLVVHAVRVLVDEAEPRVARELWPGDASSYERTMTAVCWLDDQLFGRVRRGLGWLVEKLIGTSRVPPETSVVARRGV
jgi:uncharacterized membrane protein YkvA (DUF1232 family)